MCLSRYEGTDYIEFYKIKPGLAIIHRTIIRNLRRDLSRLKFRMIDGNNSG